MNPSMTIGGFPLYPMAGTVDPSLPIYRPEYGGGGLLNDGRDFEDVRQNFAGGLLNGMQYDPYSNRFNAIAPSGVYTTDQTQGTASSGGDKPRGLTFRDAIGFTFSDPRRNRQFWDVFGGADGDTLSQVGLNLDDEYDPTNDKWKQAVRMVELFGDSTTSGGGR